MAVIRPLHNPIDRLALAPGQVWVHDYETTLRWFVLEPQRVIALFAGGADHTPKSLVYTYGDKLHLESVATVYRRTVIPPGNHKFVPDIDPGDRDRERVRVCGKPGCGTLANANVHQGYGGEFL